MKNNNPIYFKLYNPSGLINQVMSFEIAAGIFYKTNRPIIVHGIYHNQAFPVFSPSTYCEKYPDMVSQMKETRTHNLLKWEGKESFTFLDKEIFPYEKAVAIDNLQMKFLSFSEIKDDDFSDERERFSIPEEVTFLSNTLNFYSRFFFERDPIFDKKIHSVFFNDEYKELSIKIAKSLEKFNGIHLRLTDHARQMYQVTQNDFESLMSTLDNSIQNIISTDEPDHPILLNTKHKYILLDEYIYNNFKKDFKNLSCNDDVAFGIINNIVMHYSYDFIGTQGSTFSSYIQRNRIHNGLIPSWKMFGQQDFVQTGKYSWNGYNTNTLQKSWWREWEECRLNV